MFADAIASVSKSDQVIGVGVNCTAPEYVEVHTYICTCVQCNNDVMYVYVCMNNIIVRYFLIYNLQKLLLSAKYMCAV